MDYSEALEQAKTKFAVYVNAILPEEHKVNIAVYEKLMYVVAYFLWYQEQLPEDEQIEITFSNDCSKENGVVSVSLFAIDIYSKEENAKFIDMLTYADVYEISANPKTGIDLDFTFQDLYIPLEEE